MDDIVTIDWEAVDELASQVGKDMVANLFGIFFADTTEHLATCRDTFSQGDFDNLAEVAHKIKGSAGSMGLTKMRVIASDLQDKAEAKADPKELAGLVEALGGAFDEAKQAVDQGR